MERLPRLRSSILLFLLGLTSTTQAQEFGCDSLQFIIEATRGFGFEQTKPMNETKYRQFDFSKFEGSGKPANDNYYQVGTGVDGRLIYVAYFDYRNKESAGYYKLYFHSISELTIATLQVSSGKQLYFLPCIFVRFHPHGNFCLINYAPPHSARTQFEDFVPFNNFDQLTSIMYLDSNLKPEQMIRMEDRRVVYKSTFVYGNGRTKEKERISLLPCDAKFVVDNKKCLSKLNYELSEIFFTFWFESVPAKGIGSESSPLWLWAGAHNYWVD
jgi:hypothetical protein